MGKNVSKRRKNGEKLAKNGEKLAKSERNGGGICAYVRLAPHEARLMAYKASCGRMEGWYSAFHRLLLAGFACDMRA